MNPSLQHEHPPVLIDHGTAFALLDGTLMSCPVPVARPVPPLLAGSDGMAEYSIDDEWVEVDFDRIGTAERAHCEGVQRALLAYAGVREAPADRTISAPHERG